MTSLQQDKGIEFEELLNRHNLLICKICWVYSKYDKFYFEELREQCVIELWHEFSQYDLSRFRGDSKESTWIYQIALHAVAHYFRNPHNDQLQTIEGPHEQLIVTEDPDVMSMINELMQQLSGSDQLIFSHYLDNHTYAEIAEQDNISEVAARKRMSRLLTKLKMLIHNNY